MADAPEGGWPRDLDDFAQAGSDIPRRCTHSVRSATPRLGTLVMTECLGGRPHALLAEGPPCLGFGWLLGGSTRRGHRRDFRQTRP